MRLKVLGLAKIVLVVSLTHQLTKEVINIHKQKQKSILNQSTGIWENPLLQFDHNLHSEMIDHGIPKREITLAHLVTRVDGEGINLSTQVTSKKRIEDTKQNMNDKELDLRTIGGMIDIKKVQTITPGMKKSSAVKRKNYIV